MDLGQNVDQANKRGGTWSLNELLGDMGLNAKKSRSSAIDPAQQRVSSSKVNGDEMQSQRVQTFNKIIRSQIQDGDGQLSNFSKAVNAALLQSNFVETLQQQITQQLGGTKDDMNQDDASA